MATHEAELARPDLPVPLSPLRKWARLARRHFVGLRGPRFTDAHRVTAVWAAAGVALAAAGSWLPSPWQWGTVGCSALVGLYVIVRVLALATFERQQRVFEPRWMAAQSVMLRGHDFEILRFMVQNLGERDLAPPRSYDLTHPADVRELLRLRDQEYRRERQASRTTVEFSYPAGDGTQKVAEVHRKLPELIFMLGWAGPGRASIRFPEARYIPRSEPGGHPARQTYWVLSGPAMIAVNEPAYGGATGPRPPTGAPEAPTEVPEPGSAR